MTSTFLKVEMADSYFDVYAVYPATRPVPAVIVLQEIFGINDDIKATCESLAKAGYLALAPDLFWRAERRLSLSRLNEAEWKKGLDLYHAYDVDLGAQDIAAAMAMARKLPDCTGKVGVMGFCLGGLMSFLTATRGTPDAAVCYYPGGADGYIGEAAQIKSPLLIHLAEEDEFITKEAQKTIRDGLALNRFATTYSYPGCNHAFARHSGVHFNAEAAAVANLQTSEFFERHLR